MADPEIYISIDKESTDALEKLTAEVILNTEATKNALWNIRKLSEELQHLPWWLHWTLILK